MNGYKRAYDVILGTLILEAVLSIGLCIFVNNPLTANLGVGTAIGLAFAVAYEYFDNGKNSFMGRIILESFATTFLVVGIIAYFNEGQGWMAFHLALMAGISFFASQAGLRLYDVRRVLCDGKSPTTRGLLVMVRQDGMLSHPIPTPTSIVEDFKKNPLTASLVAKKGGE